MLACQDIIQVTADLPFDYKAFPYKWFLQELGKGTHLHLISDSLSYRFACNWIVKSIPLVLLIVLLQMIVKIQ